MKHKRKLLLAAVPLVALLILSFFAMRPEPSFASPAQQGLVESAVLYCDGNNGLVRSADGTTCSINELRRYLLTDYGFALLLGTMEAVEANAVAIEGLQDQLDEVTAPDFEALDDRIEALEVFDEDVFETFSEMFGALNGWAIEPN